MNRILNIFCATFASLGISCNGVSETEIKTASNVDAKEYMGTWYEVARFENSFEKGLRNAQAKYTLNDDKTVTVINSGENKNGNRSFTKGKAYAPNPKDFSKLRVCFFWPFYGDYYILELDENYQWALIGGRNKDYLWILSRTENLPSETIDLILKKAESRGYDTKKLLFNKDL